MAEVSRSFDDDLVGLFDLSLDAFCVAGFDGYLKRANPAFARSLGYTLEELLARPFMDNVSPDDVESVGRSWPNWPPVTTSSGSSVAKCAPTARCAGSSGAPAAGPGKASCTGWPETSPTAGWPMPSWARCAAWPPWPRRVWRSTMTTASATTFGG